MNFSRKFMLSVAGASLCLALPACERVKEVAADAAGLPSDKNILFWTDEQRNKAFRMMDVLAPSRTIEAGSEPRILAQGKRSRPSSRWTVRCYPLIDIWPTNARLAWLYYRMGKSGWKNIEWILGRMTGGHLSLLPNLWFRRWSEPR